MGNFYFKNFCFKLIMNEMRAILKPKLPYLYSKLLEACALFGCSHISGYTANLFTAKTAGFHCVRFPTVISLEFL